MAMITLEMVDELIEKTGVTYEEAKRVLTETDGDIEKAVAKLMDRSQQHLFDASGIDDVISKIKDILSKGTAARLIVKKGNDVILNVPAVLGVFGLMNPFLTAAGIGGVVLTGHEIVIENKDGTVIDVNEMLDKAADKVKDVGEDLVEKVRDKSRDVADKVDDFSEDVKDEVVDHVEDLEDDVDKL